MIKLTHDGHSIIFRGKTGPYYTATAESVLERANKASYLPGDIAGLRQRISEAIAEFHDSYIGVSREDFEPKGDVDVSDIPDGLSAFVVIAAVKAEWELLGRRPVRAAKYCGAYSPDKRKWVCTLPEDHSGPEHVAHSSGYGTGATLLHVCERWPTDEGELD